MANIIKSRYLATLLPNSNKPRLVLITGARQTGKTTLAQAAYPHLPYINLDAAENREKIRLIPASHWADTVGDRVIDEVQKEPATLEKLKYAYDAHQISFSVLLGSSQILLWQQVRETLAGRIAIYELFPLMMAELAATEQPLTMPLLDSIMSGIQIGEILTTLKPTLFAEQEATRKLAQQHLLQWGGMPALINIPENERMKWIRDYEYTYLERDIVDLARMHDLQPFRTLQKLAALRSAQLLNYSELARDAGIAVDTVRRYLEYLKLSYQVILLQPYYRNLTSTLIKTPKLYWMDMGLLRHLTTVQKSITGEIFETLVVSEIMKWIRTMQRNAELYFYRTRSGLEIDLIIQLPTGFIGVEIKSRQKIVSKDYTALREIAKQSGKEWLGGLIIYTGDSIIKLDAQLDIWAVPAWRLLTSEFSIK